MAVNCSTRIKKVENQLFLCLVHLHLAFFVVVFSFRIPFFSIFFPPISFFVSCEVPPLCLSVLSSLGYFILCCELVLPHHGFCFIMSSYGSHPDCARLSKAASLQSWTTVSSNRTSGTRSTVCSWKWRS